MSVIYICLLLWCVPATRQPDSLEGRPCCLQVRQEVNKALVALRSQLPRPRAPAVPVSAATPLRGRL